MKNIKIVFMGTPEFAVTVLDRMINEELNIVGVITGPDRPSGRGRKISESAIKSYSIRKNLKVLQPSNLKEDDFITELQSLEADLFVVVAFRMLPEVVWKMPEMGTINLHASLLPNYRGAAPINWAIINGEKETGVTTFYIEKEIDTGKIILSDKIKISKNMTAGELHDKLSVLGSKVIIETLNTIASGKASAVPQEQIKLDNLKNAPKIFKQDCKIDWNAPANDVHDFIRGLSPYPGAWSRVVFKKKELSCKFFDSKLTEIKKSVNIDFTESQSFHFRCLDYFISVAEIQIEGKKRMSYSEFCKGNSINDLELLRYL